MTMAQPSMMMMVQPWEAAQGGSWQEEAGGAGWKPDAAPPPGEPPARSEEPECPICRNCFDLERHVPKLLECLHTFCLHCLRQLHLRSASAQAGGAKGGQADSIPCPLCRHLTLLPGGDAQNLLLNTKLAKGSPRSPEPPPPSESLARSPERPLAAQSGSREEEEEKCSCGLCARACSSLILCALALVSVGVSVYRRLNTEPFLVPFSIIVIIVLLSCCCTICSSKRAPREEGGPGP
ncbi:RING finger protein 228-like [Tiliqua scincoides]|uniref:RING finger protein 228-like n=1 Tax=Tiliqua scincoides TaxID=71010 RepID=UPI0034619852